MWWKYLDEYSTLKIKLNENGLSEDEFRRFKRVRFELIMTPILITISILMVVISLLLF